MQRVKLGLQKSVTEMVCGFTHRIPSSLRPKSWRCCEGRGELKKHSVAKRTRVTSNARHPCVKKRKIGWLGYRLMRRLAKSPPKPKSVPITRVLGSGTEGGGGGGGGGGANEVRLATRKPKSN